MSTLTHERPKLRLELSQEPDFGRPCYLCHVITDQARAEVGAVIDCSGEDCDHEAVYFVSCGGLKQTLCATCEFIAHAKWHERNR